MKSFDPTPLFNAMPNKTKGVPLIAANRLLVRWARKGIGFGELTLVVKEDGTLFIDDEGMGREFVKEILGQLVDEATLWSDRREEHDGQRQD